MININPWFLDRHTTSTLFNTVTLTCHICNVGTMLKCVNCTSFFSCFVVIELTVLDCWISLIKIQLAWFYHFFIIIRSENSFFYYWFSTKTINGTSMMSRIVLKIAVIHTEYSYIWKYDWKSRHGVVDHLKTIKLISITADLISETNYSIFHMGIGYHEIT